MFSWKKFVIKGDLMFNKDDFKAVNAVRTLSVAQIEKANSGHPGLPMGASPMAYALFNKVLKANPKNPSFFDRKRTLRGLYS